MDYTNLAYVAAAVLFILGIKRLSSPKTARTGNALASVGMLIAIVATVFSFGGLDFRLIAIGMIIGSIIGATFALRVEMTQMPQMVAIFNGFGGGASALVATAEFFSKYGSTDQTIFLSVTIILSIFIGYYVVWSVTPSLHTPLMSVTNAISSVIIVGAIIAALAGNSESVFNTSSIFGFIAIILAAINIFGGFLVTQRMLQMYKKKKDKKK